MYIYFIAFRYSAINTRWLSYIIPLRFSSNCFLMPPYYTLSSNIFLSVLIYLFWLSGILTVSHINQDNSILGIATPIIWHIGRYNIINIWSPNPTPFSRYETASGVISGVTKHPSIGLCTMYHVSGKSRCRCSILMEFCISKSGVFNCFARQPFSTI